MKKIILLGVACLLTGCFVSLDEVSTTMNTKWVGKTYDEFVMEKGLAKNSHKLSSGMTMYMWEEEGVVGGTQAATTVHCILNILVDTNNVIKSVKASGSARVCSLE